MTYDSSKNTARAAPEEGKALSGDGWLDVEPGPTHYEAAVNWLIRLREAGQTSDPQFEQWRREDPANEFAFAEIEATFAVAAVPTEGAARRDRGVGTVVRKPAYRRLLPYALAASLALALSVPAMNQLRLMSADELTRAGEIRKVRLADGSIVTLNTRTALDTEAGKDGRSTRLLAGEAYFEVVHDPSRPFTVRTSNALVRVLGTKFNVRTDGDRSIVSVTQGRVQVALADRAQASVLLSADQEAIVRGEHLSKQPADPIAEASWRSHKIVFRSTPLREVVAELNRYRMGSIHIFDHKLGERIVTGIFRTDDPDGAVRIINQTLNTKSLTLPTGQTFLY